MKELQMFRQGSRGCLINLLGIVLAMSAMTISTNYHDPQPASCKGMIGAGLPVLFICDDWGGGSPTDSWGKIDFIDVINGGIRPGGFFIDLLFYTLLILITWFAISSLLQKGVNHRHLGWVTCILLGFMAGFSLAFLTVWSSDLYIKIPPLGTPAPIIPSASASESVSSMAPLATLTP